MLAINCTRRGFCPACSAHRMSQTAAHFVYHVILHVLPRRRLLSPPTPPRELLAAQPKLVAPVLQAAALAYQIACGHGTAKTGECQRQQYLRPSARCRVRQVSRSNTVGRACPLVAGSSRRPG